MDLAPSSEAKSSSANKKHLHGDWWYSTASATTHINPVHTLPPYLFNAYFNGIIPSVPRPSKFLLHENHKP
jgi:hypothetical protein